MEEIVAALKRDRSNIRQVDYSRIINKLQGLGYRGAPERWHDAKRPVKVVLPEKIQWFIDNDVEVTAGDIRAALKSGKVDV